MASSDNFPSLDPSWLFRSSFPSDPWLCDPSILFSTPPRDSDSALITRALSHTLIPTTTTAELDTGFSNSPSPHALNNNNVFSDMPHSSTGDSSTPVTTTSTTTVPAQSISTTSGGSDPETSQSKRKGSASAAAAASSKKKIGKRKSRASKKSPTTFITADASNFRQMVQEITGVKFPPTTSMGGVGSMFGSILRPEPQRMNGRIHDLLSGGGGGCVPTLDTSTLLLNHHRQQGAASLGVGAGTATGLVEFPAGMMGCGVEDGAVAEVGGGGGDSGGGGGFDFDGYSCFPTLESCSWKVK